MSQFVIFTRAAHDPAHNNGCDSLLKKDGCLW